MFLFILASPLVFPVLYFSNYTIFLNLGLAQYIFALSFIYNISYRK